MEMNIISETLPDTLTHAPRNILRYAEKNNNIILITEATEL